MKISPKLWQVIIPLATMAAGYFGYEPVQERLQAESIAHDTNVEVVIPEQKEHAHKNWLPEIDARIQKAIDENNVEYH